MGSKKNLPRKKIQAADHGKQGKKEVGPVSRKWRGRREAGLSPAIRGGNAHGCPCRNGTVKNRRRNPVSAGCRVKAGEKVTAKGK